MENPRDWRFFPLKNRLLNSLCWEGEGFQSQLTRLVLLEKILKCITFSSQKSIKSLFLKYRYIGSFTSEFVPVFPNGTSDFVNNQSSYMQCEQWIMKANFRYRLLIVFFRLSWKEKYSFLKQHYKQIMPEPLQCLPSVCSFYAKYATSFKIPKRRKYCC